MALYDGVTSQSANNMTGVRSTVAPCQATYAAQASTLLAGYAAGYAAGQIVADLSQPNVIVNSLPTNEENALVITIWDVEGFLWIELLCRDREAGPMLAIYDSTEGFLHPFGGRSALTGSGTVLDPYVFTIYRRGRWPTGISLAIKIRAVDLGGHVKQTSTTISI